jgi:hypothetical protein
MALTKTITVDQITILEDGQIQVREVTRIMEDGEELSHSYHRKVVKPGDTLIGEDARVTEIAGVVHKPAVVAAFQAKQQL